MVSILEDFMDIENLATTTVIQSISRTDYLSPFINSGDKEPSWDGNIYVYNDKISKGNRHKKDNLVGRAPVQVKGRNISGSTKKNKINYSIEVSDLINYLKDSGTVYFVVYMNDEEEETIYYISLLPYLINKILKNKENQGSVSVELLPFPKDNDEKCNILFNFVRNRQIQKGNENNSISLDDVNNIQGIEKLSFSYTNIAYNKLKPFEYLFSHGVYVYAETKYLNAKIPIGYINEFKAVKASVNHIVSVNGTAFFSDCEIVFSQDREEFHFGKSFKMKLYKDGNARFDYKMTDLLNERICDEKFFIEALNYKEISIGTVKIPFSFSTDDTKTIDLDALRSELHYLEKVQYLLNYLKVKENLNISKVTNKHEDMLKVLLIAINEQETVKLDTEDEINHISAIDIGNLKLALLFVKQENDEYIIRNFFDREGIKELNIYIKDNTGITYECSPYVILKKCDFLRISNIDYSEIWDSINSVKPSNLYYDHLNFLLLNMIAAYDEDAPHKDELFDIMIKISSLLLKDNEGKGICMLNYLQCIKRRRILNDDEILKLCSIIESGIKDEPILTGAYLLLDNQIAAKMHFNKLSSVEQANFKEFPIWKFWNEKN